MVLVKPATVVQWHRQGFRLFWRWRSRSGRPSLDRETRKIIRQISSANPLWGAPRIHGELLKLGIEVSQATVAKYMIRRTSAPSPTQPGRSDEQITEVVTAPRSPWQNAYVERVLGSIRRECLDHMVIFNERHLRRVLSSYVDYYQGTRTHLSLDKDCPDPRPIMHAGSERWSPSRKSAACITVTNVSPPDSSRILGPCSPIVASRAVRCRLKTSVS